MIELKKYRSLLIISILAIVIGLAFAKGELPAIIFSIAIIFAFIFLLYALKNPTFPLKIAFIFSFFAIGLTRYIDAPIGLGIDFLLVLTWIVVGLKKNKNFEWKNAQNFSVLFVVCWFTYIFLQLFNPESLGAEPWFYAMRGMALYPLLILPLFYILLNKKTDISWMIKTWFIISILAALKAFVQKYIDCDSYEKIWLAQGGAVTHVLFGQLRAFSFYSDAGQFGAAMAHASLSSFILFTGPYAKWKKIILFVLFILFFWGYLVSGTRGAIAVFVGGFVLFLFLSKNFKLLIYGGVMISAFYFFMAFTTIGQGNNEIRRLRTAFTAGTEDASMIVRIENQKKLKGFLADKPFGGGVGSAGDWGKRFNPDSVLANIATDSYYVRIWAETGIVGLSILLIFFFYFIIRGAYIIWNIKDLNHRNKLLALYCGVVGIMVASYSNSVFSQFPTSLICYASMCFIFLAEREVKVERGLMR